MPSGSLRMTIIYDSSDGTIVQMEKEYPVHGIGDQEKLDSLKGQLDHMLSRGAQDFTARFPYPRVLGEN